MTVGTVLRAYADRGVLRDFSAATGKAADDYGFLWMNHMPMRVQWKPALRTIVFRDVAPNVPARGPMNRELKVFLEGLTLADRPPHRRVDPAQFELFCENRRTQVSIGLRIKDAGEAEAMEKLLLVIHETFLYLHDRWPDYMHTEFGASLE